jgi:trehalose transport system substrate-binding protein
MKEGAFRLVFTAALAALVLAACGGGNDGKPVLKVSFSLAESEWEVFRSRIFPEFEKRYGCAVEAVQVSAGDLPKLLEVGKRSGSPTVDLFAQDNMGLSVLVKNRLVEDLSGLEDRLPHELYPSMLNAGRFDDVLYFIPFRPNVQIFYYNEAKFDEYGVEPPRSWEEWLKAAKTFYEKEGVGRILIKAYGGSPTVTQMYEYIVSAGGDPFTFNDEGFQGTFAFFRKLWKFASPDSKRAKWDTSNDYFAQDSVYLMQNWPFGYKILTEKYGKKNVGVYQGFPGPVREAHVIGGDVFGIPAGSKRRELSVKLVQYLLSRDVQSLLVRELGWPSVRRDAYHESESPAFRAVRKALEHGVFRKNVPYWGEYQKLFEEAFLRIVVNEEKLSLLDRFHDRMQDIVAKHESGVP